VSAFVPPRLHQKFLYLLIRGIYREAFRWIWRLEVTGRENVPGTGAVILASNHLSLADPPLVGSSIRRMIHYFAKEELFRYPVFGWIIRQVNAFPVKRAEHDVGAFKRAQTLLKHGQAVVLFPEGRRSRTGEIGRAKPGVGMLAYKTKAPVVPVCIRNSDRLREFRKLRVSFGSPMFAPPAKDEKEAYQAFSDEVLARVAELDAKMYNDARTR